MTSPSRVGALGPQPALTPSLVQRFELTRRNWNECTPIHAASEFYDVAGFKAGRITLCDIERRELGPVAGKSLLHLQCHFGMDTLSWARLGARATGVDISDASIDLAQELNAELGLAARFIRANVYDLPTLLDERFDVVYTGVGAICWLPDLTAWAQVVARYLDDGGTFYILDVHPTAQAFESVAAADGAVELRPAASYFPDAAGLLEDGERPSYAGTTPITTPVYEWQHNLSEVVNALIDAGLAIRFLNEFPVSVYQAFPQMRQTDGWWRLPPAQHRTVPLLFSIKAVMAD